MKRVFALILAVIMMVSVTVTVSAEGADSTYYLSGDYFYTILEDGTAEIGGYSGSADVLEVASQLDNKTVTSIGELAFSECAGLSEVVLADTITSVGNFAFYDCTDLKSIVFSKSVSKIGEGALSGCDNLTDVTIFNRDCMIIESEDSIPYSAVIFGFAGSTAEKYANNFGRRFVALSDSLDPDYTKPEFELGDVDLDGEVSIMDATAIQMHVAFVINLSNKSLEYADADRDGEASIMDATAIQLFVAQLIDSL